MRYTQFTENQVQEMLATIGVDSMASLFKTIPQELRLKRELNIPEGLSEFEILRDTTALASRNRSCNELTCFLGGGAYDHFIPTIVDALAGQSEFLTAYTPYQAEASQGILQLFFEFQTMVARLTGMETANASLYELASAAAEAVLMAMQITGRHRAILAGRVHPDVPQVLCTYAKQRDLDIVSVPAPDGVVDPETLAAAVDDSTAAVFIQSPNSFGCIERLDRLIPIVRDRGAMVIVGTDPIAAGLLRSPGKFGADLVVAEGQALGVPLQYGGPYLGLLSGRERYLRRMPGRVVGMTRDLDGRRGFCLALQTREQHIRRERATSNICTNQGLLAIRAAIYMASMGRSGLGKVARLCFDKAHYAASEIDKLDGYQLRFGAPFFKEFVVRSRRPVREVLAACRSRGILAGIPLVRVDDAFSDCFLVAVTEKRTKKEIDGLVDALRQV